MKFGIYTDAFTSSVARSRGYGLTLLTDAQIAAIASGRKWVPRGQWLTQWLIVQTWIRDTTGVVFSIDKIYAYLTPQQRAVWDRGLTGDAANQARDFLGLMSLAKQIAQKVVAEETAAAEGSDAPPGSGGGSGYSPSERSKGGGSDDESEGEGAGETSSAISPWTILAGVAVTTAVVGGAIALFRRQE